MGKNISKEITIEDLLKKYDLLDTKTRNLLWHMNAGKISIEKIKKIYVFSEGLTEEQIAKEVFFLVQNCDLNSQDYDNDLYVSLCRLGFNTVKYNTGCSHKYNGIPDDNYGFGTKYSHQLDVYNDGSVFDSENNLKGIK